MAGVGDSKDEGAEEKNKVNESPRSIKRNREGS